MFYFVYEKQDFEDDALMDLEPMHVFISPTNWLSEYEIQFGGLYAS